MITINQAMRDLLIALWSANPPLSQVADKLRVYLINQVFTPSAVLVPGDVTTAAFTGGAFKEAGLGDPNVITDPTSGIQYLQLLDPAGGFTWIATVAPGAPETIYGYMITDHANAAVYGCERFAANVVITNVGDGVQLGQVRYQIPLTILS